MSHPPVPPVATTITSFHELAARRGEGLHPQILAALTKSGPVSGPPDFSKQTDDNVVRIDFAAPRGKHEPTKALRT